MPRRGGAAQNDTMSGILHRVGLRSQRGGITIQIVILLVLLLGFAALSVEVVAMLMTKRHMQSAADSSALAAAMAVERGYPVAYADESTAVSRNAGPAPWRLTRRLQRRSTCRAASIVCARASVWMEPKAVPSRPKPPSRDRGTPLSANRLGLTLVG